MLTQLQCDTLRGLAASAIGQTVERLQNLWTDWTLSPDVRVQWVDAADIRMALDANSGGVSQVLSQAFFGDGVSGEALLLMEDYEQVVQTSLDPAGGNSREALFDFGSLLLGCGVKALLDPLDITVLFKHPILLEQQFDRGTVSGWQRTLAVELESAAVDGSERLELMVLFHPKVLPVLANKIGALID